jgi:hypothetical protein
MGMNNLIKARSLTRKILMSECKTAMKADSSIEAICFHGFLIGKLSFSFRRQKSDQKRPEFRVGFNNFRHLLF